ncbi:DoxX family membrane protein [Pedobacter flavus]|uniref:DoxX family membrane protein n=1 Tax=Pedobacter flavus TaxID=3113906 RepID=A0ABU7H3L1_9SPHI|nr:DoxX family membrane protein [Pedobacter sp. VNH31]MEE1885919.1 DoxX family membrane protein [Pedobacter sp. VNH31]
MKSKFIFIASLLFGLVFINSGLNKFFNYMPMPADLPEKMVKLNAAFVEIGWLLPLVAIVEIIAGLLFIFTKTRALAAVMIFPIMVGVMLIHTLQAPEGLLIASILFLINIWVLYENRGKYKGLINE